MIYSPLQLANRLKLIRQRNGWTQSELAKKVGLKQATISHFENALTVPRWQRCLSCYSRWS